MKISVLGTGIVGRTIATKLVKLGHEVMIGTRYVSQLMESKQAPFGQNLTFSQWLEQTPGVIVGTFAEAAAFGELAFNCTNGAGTLDALKMAGEVNLNGKILVDITNALDFSRGMPPTLTVCNTDSLGEQIQRTFPGIKSGQDSQHGDRLPYG